MSSKGRERLPAQVKVCYGVADAGIAMLTASLQFFLLFFYTDIARIQASLAGLALMVGKLTWDAFNDPVFGYLSDRVRTPLGRRRPFLLFGAVPLGLVTWLLFSIPAGLAGVRAFLVILGSFLLFDTLHTLVSVPYYALTPELTLDYDERTSLTAVRMIFSVVGYILGAASTPAIAGLFEGLGWTEQAAYSGMGGVLGGIAAVTVLVTGLTVKEPPPDETRVSRLPPLSALVQTFRNRPFVQLLAAFTISSFSFALMTSLLPYYLTYHLEMEAQVSLVLLIMLGTVALFLFPWKVVADRINKGPSYALGLFLASLAVIGTYFLPHRPTPLVYAIAFVAGLGFSAQWVFPWSMLPDVVEYDQKETGERREGTFYGVWALLNKFTNALGVAVSGWALDLFGYVPGVAQTEFALLGIRLFFGLIPSIILIASLPLLIWYPVTKASHLQVRAELERMQIQK